MSADSSRHFADAAMAFMAERQIAPTPENFQIFYSYASGNDPALKEAISKLLTASNPFSPTVLEDLQTHFTQSRKTENAIGAVTKGMSGALNEVLDRIASAERDTVAYGQTLSQASGELGGTAQSAIELHKLVNTLIVATQTMENRTRNLETELQRSSNEIGELRTKLDDARKETLRDPLTGVCNRKAFDTELEAAIDRYRRTEEPLCLLMCDIDRFKRFNDTWGHQTGDHVLRLVASCLSENVKGRDTAARYGGEEFAVILPQTSLADAIALANSIRTRVESKKLQKRSTGEILGVITISIGVSLFAESDTAETLVQRADACLYAAKNAGRNLVMAQTEIPATRAA